MQLSRELEIERTPKSAQGIIRKALEGTSSPRQAIKGRCLQCSNYVREEIAQCTVTTCALWQYRPYQPGEDEDDSVVTEQQTAESTPD